MRAGPATGAERLEELSRQILANGKRTEAARRAWAAKRPAKTPKATDFEMLQRIQRAVELEFHLSPGTLHRRSRVRWLALPRQIAMHLQRRLTEWGTHVIGGFWGMDHATVYHADQRIAAARVRDKALSERLEKIERAVKSGELDAPASDDRLCRIESLLGEVLEQLKLRA